MKRFLRNYDKALLNNSNTENFNNAPTTLDLHRVNKRRPSAVDKPEAKILKQEDSKKILTFGFIGLSNIVARYVNNLIKSGHKIIIWSISSLKCTPINGAILASNGEDLVKMSDIIFSCFGNERRGYDDLYHMNEIISMITNGKGYIEMSGIDIQLSETFNKDIASNGGRYLEVFLSLIYSRWLSAILCIIRDLHFKALFLSFSFDGSRVIKSNSSCSSSNTSIRNFQFEKLFPLNKGTLNLSSSISVIKKKKTCFTISTKLTNSNVTKTLILPKRIHINIKNKIKCCLGP